MTQINHATEQDSPSAIFCLFINLTVRCRDFMIPQAKTGTRSYAAVWLNVVEKFVL